MSNLQYKVNMVVLMVCSYWTNPGCFICCIISHITLCFY